MIKGSLKESPDYWDGFDYVMFVCLYVRGGVGEGLYQEYLRVQASVFDQAGSETSLTFPDCVYEMLRIVPVLALL